MQAKEIIEQRINELITERLKLKADKKLAKEANLENRILENDIMVTEHAIRELNNILKKLGE